MPEPMFDLAEAIRAHALSYPGIVGLIENEDDTCRWYGPTLEQGSALPAVTVQLVSSVDAAETQQGHSGLERARYQITVWSGCGRKMGQLQKEILHAFKGYRGIMGGPGGIEVQRCAHANMTDLGREPGRNAYKRALDFYFLYRMPE